MSLLQAVRSNNVAAVERLISARADVNVHDWNSYPPLLEGLYSFEITKMLLNAGAHVPDDALPHATFHSLHVVDLLLDAKAKIDGKDHNDMTALFVACMQQRLDMIIHLRFKGANSNERCLYGETSPLQYAREHNLTTILTLL